MWSGWLAPPQPPPAPKAGALLNELHPEYLVGAPPLEGGPLWLKARCAASCATRRAVLVVPSRGNAPRTSPVPGERSACRTSTAMELRAAVDQNPAPACSHDKCGLALSRVAQHVCGVPDRFRSGTYGVTVRNAEPLHHGHHWNCRRATLFPARALIRCSRAAPVCAATVVLVVRVGFAPTTFPL